MKNIFLILIIASSVGCKYKMEQTIKKGYFDSCPKYDVETMIESYFADPKWESFISPDDNNYHLNVSGRIMYNGQESKAILQFELLDGKRWKINAFEINGEEQNDFMTSALISEMCSSAEEAAAKAKAAEEAAKVNRNTSPGASAPAAASPKQPQSAAAVIDSTSAAAPAPPAMQSAKLGWNYSGTIDRYPIKARIDYGEGAHSSGSGALQIPITGYYFYEGKDVKIPIEGSCNGAGDISFRARTSGGYETFEGQFSGSMLEDFSGTWSNGKKQLSFSLSSRK